MVRSFMEMDSIQPNQALLDASDPTERHFAATHKRSTDGVYGRIVWRTTENEPLLHFRLLTVTYGLAPSPFLAVRVLKQLADDHGHEYPAAAHALLHDAYVDDIPTGANTFDELMILKDELIALLDKGKFKLRK
ncbi:GM24542 [Drosophila sechellia]|uniref:GM24542 n=1 Tax=Drosophila sechellia TaxID=7238 RepID=B4IN31_DROSE|nr:GM24542 [Drosophila sechellia]